MSNGLSPKRLLSKTVYIVTDMPNGMAVKQFLSTVTATVHQWRVRWRLCCGGEFGLHRDQLHHAGSGQPPA